MIKLNLLKGYEDVEDGYFVTTCGKIFSTRKNRLNTKGFLVMKVFIDNDGYRNVYPRKKDGKTKTVRLCRAIATAYIPNDENKPQVDHINRIKNDDRISNLRWATPSENSNNRNTPKIRHNAKLIDVLKGGVVVIESLYAREIVEKYGVRRSSIYQILCGKSRAKTSKGYAFKYSECND